MIIMKKMRGVVDPISLGFILSAVIFGVGVTTTGNNPVEGDRVAKAKVEASQEVTVQHATAPKAQSSHAIYDY
jgi:hypothetical protein